MADNKLRVNITLSVELKEWYSTQAEAFGCSVSAMMAIALAQYKQTMEGMNVAKQLPDLMAQLQQMQQLASEVKK